MRREVQPNAPSASRSRPGTVTVPGWDRERFGPLRERRIVLPRTGQGFRLLQPLDLDRLLELLDLVARALGRTRARPVHVPVGFVRAVARVLQHSCQGCRVTIPTSEEQRARLSSELVFCSSCGRILYVSQ